MKLKLLFMLFFASFLLNSCSKEGDDELLNVGSSDEKTSSHTTLVYIVADNNLNNYVSQDIEEMIEGYAQITDTANCKLLAYIDNDSSPYLLKFRKVDNTSKAVIDTIVTYNEQNSLETDIMSGVINQALSSNHADSYGLVLWSHGNGWLPGSSEKQTSTKAFGEDNNNSNDKGFYMDIINLRKALEKCPVFEYIMFDACMMQGIEVAYELRNRANYFIASPVEIPGYGAYYKDVVPAFFTKTNKEKAITQAYFNYYNNLYNYTGNNNFPSGSLPEFLENIFWGSSIINGIFPGDGSVSYSYGLAISLIASDKLDNLALATKDILTRKIKDGQTVKTSEIYSYDDNFYNYYYDLKDFILSLNGKDSYYMTWEKAFKDAVPMYLTTDYTYSSFANKGVGGMTSMKGSSGISTYIPANANFMSGYFWSAYLLIYPKGIIAIREHQNYLNEYYKGFSWYTESGWNETGW